MPESDRDPSLAEPPAAERARHAAGRGLDWLNLFVANVQTGFGPFLAVYLTTEGWTQTAIGLALSLGTITAMASQVPAGALVDAVPRKSLVAVFSILAFTASALLFTVAPIPLFVYLGQVASRLFELHAGPGHRGDERRRRRADWRSARGSAATPASPRSATRSGRR